ncbi:MAG: leucine-rich repeat domain-containing protein [Bacteroidaceae bacterium]|nr:leucine-rich repeat domain-containing protein [Bacteroidaceae bacterium]
MKRKLQILCVALLAFVLCNIPLFAEDFEVDGIYYNITSEEDKTVEVTTGSYKYSGVVTIPESVTNDGSTYSVTSIGDNAFSVCSSLTSVVIGNNVTSIGEKAFSNTYQLTSVVIGNSVTTIGVDAFWNCSGLTSVEIPNSVTSIEHNAFSGCSSLTSVEIGNNVTCISPSAFRNCSSLTSVEIPNSVTSIGDDAFSWCYSLTSVVIGNNVTSISTSAFYGCYGLTSIYIAADNPTYDSRDNCNAIIETQTNTLILGSSKTIIPNSVTSIGSDAFYERSNLTSVVIPNSVTSIGTSAFSGCSSLTSVEIGNNVTYISMFAFSSCSSLTSVEIPNSVTRIGGSAFRGCSSLTSVEIPNSVTRIGDSAFDICPNLTTATVGCSWKTNPLYDFGENVAVNATLHSYENGVCTVCGEGEFVEIELVEGTPFENDETREVAKVTYNRTLPNLKWNALYLPVEIPVAELSENYDVAYFNNMHAYDRNDDGTIDEMDMEIFLIKEGTLHANHPYFIRAKSEAAKQLTLELTDVTLYSTDEASCTSITAASAYMNFELIGVYERCEAEELTGCYAINTSGAWSPIALGSYLNPFRFYLKMISRNGSPVKVDEALKSIRIRLHGEEGTTGIDNMTINCPQTPAIYDLQGRRVSNPGRGMYIVNGKKVMIQ